MENKKEEISTNPLINKDYEKVFMFHGVVLEALITLLEKKGVITKEELLKQASQTNIKDTIKNFM